MITCILAEDKPMKPEKQADDELTGNCWDLTAPLTSSPKNPSPRQ